MFKKILTVVCAAGLLAACTTTQQGADIYGDTTGGWRNDVNITELGATEMTKKFAAETTPTVYFELNSSTLDAVAKDSLRSQINWLKDNQKVLVVIEGRCDERGTREYNLALGDRRANVVRSYLIANGIAANRIQTISYGKDKPVVLGSNESAWTKNRNATTVAY